MTEQLSPKAINKNFTEIFARVRALEYIVAQNTAIDYIKAGVSEDDMKRNHAELRKAMETLTFPTMGAAKSDAWADELQRAMVDLLRLIEGIFASRRAE